MNCPPAWHHTPSVRSGEEAYEINKQIKGLGRMISTGRPYHITVLRLPRPTAWLYKSSGVACSGVTSSLVLAHTQVVRGAHQATSKLGSSPFSASPLRTIWRLRKVVFNMQPDSLDKAPRFLLAGLGEDGRGASAALGTGMLVQLFLHQSSESYPSPECRSFLTRSSQSRLQQ